jgi:hypothetical protein
LTHETERERLRRKREPAAPDFVSACGENLNRRRRIS